MLDFKEYCDNNTKKQWLETSLSGKPLLTTPQLNKGTAFSERERTEFGLRGKLPGRIETLDEQIERSYWQYLTYSTLLQKNIFLHNLHDTNHVLFYALVRQHLQEMLPLLYTPVVGERVKEFSREFRHARGLYITYQDQDVMGEVLANRSNPEIDIIVVTDGESVLGIGDQGIGAMDIPVAKLMVYTLGGGINPSRTLPILLDLGTNNEELLADPLYLGLRQRRIRGEAYDNFIAAFVAAVKEKCPKAFLHWEDFGAENAHRNLARFRDKVCSFNDDIQGTGVVTLAALLAAIHATSSTLTEQRIVIFGGGSAGTGIAAQIHAAMTRAGLTPATAAQKLWLIDRNGLLTTNSADLTPNQKLFAHPSEEIAAWNCQNRDRITLAETIQHVHPTVLIGCSTMTNAFNEDIVKSMAQHVQQPIIFPLSNPTEKAEAHPADLMRWTEGKALIATGSPFGSIEWQGSKKVIAQCNNALVFPGIGLGVIASHATQVSDNMLWQACMALSECAPILKDSQAPLLPSIDSSPQIAAKIALAVAQEAIREGFAPPMPEEDLIAAIQKNCWEPHYVPYYLKK